MQRAVHLAAALLGAAALGACPNGGARPPKDAGTSSKPGPERARVKVPLPEGWSARATQEGVLWVGPPGRDVLRIEVHPGQAEDLPSADALAREFQASLLEATSRVIDVKSQDSYAILIFELSMNIKDGGIKPDVVLIGAKRAGGDMFLCSSVPGAAEEEVKIAASACEQLAYAAP